MVFGAAHPDHPRPRIYAEPTTGPRKMKMHTFQGCAPVDYVITPHRSPASLEAAISETEKAHLHEWPHYESHIRELHNSEK